MLVYPIPRPSQNLRPLAVSQAQQCSRMTPVFPAPSIAYSVTFLRRAVFEFSGGVFPVSETSPVTHLRGSYFEHLLREEKTAFWTYQFPIEYLPTNEETIINTIFQRINKNTARLTRQELRHAKFGGPFIAAAEELTEDLFKTLPEGFPRIESQSKKQMKDVELVANLLLFLVQLSLTHPPEGCEDVISDPRDLWFAMHHSDDPKRKAF